MPLRLQNTERALLRIIYDLQVARGGLDHAVSVTEIETEGALRDPTLPNHIQPDLWGLATANLLRERINKDSRTWRVTDEGRQVLLHTLSPT